MDRAKAERVRGSIDSDKPFYSRVAFVETHATLLSLYDDEVNTSSNAGRSLRQSILFAIQPHRSEWCFNGTRARHASSQAMLEFLPSCTTANEALHPELNVWFIESTALHVATLKMKMRVFLCAKLISHHCAFFDDTTRQINSAMVLVRALGSRSLWTSQEWAAWCLSAGGFDHAQERPKARLHLARERARQSSNLSNWNDLTRRSDKTRLRGPLARRTVFEKNKLSSLRATGRVCKRPAAPCGVARRLSMKTRALRRGPPNEPQPGMCDAAVGCWCVGRLRCLL